MKKLLIFICVLSRLSVAAQNITYFDSPNWTIQAKDATVEEFQGQKCLRIVDGIAYLKEADFLNGIIQFDIAVAKTRHFPGILFRMKDVKNAEEFYIRPHQSGNPDAMQYSPVYNDIAAWQLYYGEGFSAAKNYTFDTWMHIKIVISGMMGEVYFNNDEQPALFMHTLKREPAAGMLAIDNRSDVTVRFANFSYAKMDNPPIKSMLKIKEPLAKGTIKKWQISNTFDENSLQNKLLLNEEENKTLTWQSLLVEELGIANLSKISAITAGKNTVFAKFTIESDKAQLKKMAFGFSDRCKVYLNGKLLYGGSDNYISRDYRFLGTMGFWDELYLDLKKGKNEIWMAVSENFGGWGVEAKLDDLTDLKIVE